MQSLINTDPKTAKKILIENPNILNACEELLTINRLV